ncbi:MAG: hypothetical protein P4L81_08435 [Candidatus Pacebacteria bacterium]|nr:hypothetical protein [Candidatus Paceibacterota bacterium]
MGEKLNYQSPFKGRFAEAITEMMFRGSGVDIRRTGYEWIRPLLPTRDVNFNAGLKNQLSGMPDFYLLLPKEGEAPKLEREFVEVKFCWDGWLPRNWEIVEEVRNSPWQPTLIVIQYLHHAPHVKGSRMLVYHSPYKMSHGHIEGAESVLDQERWHIDPDVYARCEEMIDLFQSIEKILGPPSQ